MSQSCQQCGWMLRHGLCKKCGWTEPEPDPNQGDMFPTLRSLLGAAPDLTGGVDSVTHVRRIRDAQHFDGPAYEPVFDKERLTGQLLRIYTLMRDGQWRTLNEIADQTDSPQASVSAQLHHLRKPRFGGHEVKRRRRGDPSLGLWEYMVVVCG